MSNVPVKEQLTNNDKKVLSSNAIRQLEVLSKYCDVDVEHRLVTITSEIEKATDLISLSIGNKEHPVIENGFLESLSSSLHSIPEEFKLKIDLTIEDLQDYKPENIMDGMQDSLEIFNYDLTKEKKKNAIKMAFLLFAGVFFFALLFYLCSFNMFSQNEVTHNTIHEIVYTIACVLLWEGIYILFLPDNSYNSINESLLSRIDSFAISSNNKVLIERNMETIKKDWIHETKKDKRYKKWLLACGTGAMCFGAIMGLDVVGFARLIPEDPGLSISLIVITALIGLIMFFTGVSAICYYTNRGKLKNYLPLLTSISLFFSIGFIVILSLTQNNSTNRYSLIVTCVVTVLLIITLVCACKLHKKDKEYKNY